MGKTVIIHASNDDPHAKSVANKLIEIGTRAIILAREECFDAWEIACHDNDVVITTHDVVMRCGNIQSVFWRRDFIVEPEWVRCQTFSTQVTKFLAEQRSIHVESTFKRLIKNIPCVNDISANRTSGSKTLQHFVGRQCGLRVPATYIGSDPREADMFVRHLWNTGRRCCTKNIESTHLEIEGLKHARFTRMFLEENLPDLQGLSACPMIFQEYVEKKYEYRVTVVGQEVYACRIDSQIAGGDTAIDWRHYEIPKTPHFAAVLDNKLQNNLVNLVRNLGLTYGAIDLVENPEGEFFFLEINSMGQWLWIEDLTDLPISNAIARHLANPNLINGQ